MMRHRRIGGGPLVYGRPDGARAKSLFAGPPKPPKQSDPTPMPDLMDPAIMAAQRRRLASSMARSGRASTDLTGDEYSGDKLGSR